MPDYEMLADNDFLGAHIRCAQCGRKNDCARALDGSDKKPPVGAVSICLNCAGIGIWNGTNWRQPSEAEAFKMSEEPEIALTQYFILQRKLEVWDKEGKLKAPEVGQE